MKDSSQKNQHQRTSSSRNSKAFWKYKRPNLIRINCINVLQEHSAVQSKTQEILKQEREQERIRREEQQRRLEQQKQKEQQQIHYIPTSEVTPSVETTYEPQGLDLSKLDELQEILTQMQVRFQMS